MTILDLRFAKLRLLNHRSLFYNPSLAVLSSRLNAKALLKSQIVNRQSEIDFFPKSGVLRTTGVAHFFDSLPRKQTSEVSQTSEVFFRRRFEPRSAARRRNVWLTLRVVIRFIRQNTPIKVFGMSKSIFLLQVCKLEVVLPICKH